MYVVGDKIVHPLHGAGVVEAVETQEVLGESREYYVLRVPFNDIKLMIPCQHKKDSSIREVTNKDEIGSLFEHLRSETTKMNDNWNHRYRENMDKLKTGNVYTVCEVVRNLMRADRIKKLSAGEKKLLADAKNILLSELVLVTEEHFDTLVERVEAEVFSSVAS
jgi:CarD family transcriptional regulator